jgi:hypothetical protein
LIGLATTAAVAVPLAVIGVSGLELVARPATGLAAAPGESHDGLPLRDRQPPIGGDLLRVRADASPELLPSAETVLTLRQGCAWGQPGRQPYRGTTEQALTAAGLPPDVVQQIAAQRQAGQKTGRLEISRNAIRQVDGPRSFNPRSMAMSFGLTLCLHSRVNFAPGHVEPADLYEARDASGRLYSVMVPDVCGNVTVLGARAPGGLVAGVAGALTDRGEALALVAEALVVNADADPSDPGPVAGGRAGGGSGGASEADDVMAGAVVPAAYVAGAGGGAQAARVTSTRIGAALWQGLQSSTVPRQVAAVGLKRVAVVLARGGETVRTLAVVPPDGTPPPGAPGAPRYTGSQEVPEPGSLASTLVALLALAAARWVGRRRMRRPPSRP